MLNYIEESYNGSRTLLFTETREENDLFRMGCVFKDDKKILPVRLNNYEIDLYGSSTFTQKLIMHKLKSSPELSIEEIRKRNGTSSGYFYNELFSLEKQGLVIKQKENYSSIFS